MPNTYENFISKIVLPGGGTYWLKDQEARELIATIVGGSYFIGVTTTPITDGSTNPVVSIGGVSKTAVNGNMVIYGQKEFVWVDGTGSTGQWYEFGDLNALGNLAYKDNVALNKGAGNNVLGETTTFTAASSSVSFAAHTTDNVLGENTTFSVTQPTITVTPSTTNVKATASGTAVGADGTIDAVTGYNAPSSLQFVRSVSAESNKKLVTTSITPTNGTETVSKVTKTTKQLQTTTIPNVTSVGTPSSWTFTMGTGSADAETLYISGSNSIAPTLGSAITAATGTLVTTGGVGTVVDSVTIEDKTVAKQGSAVTVATGTTASDGGGDSIVTGITIGEQAEAIVGLGTASKQTVLTGVKVTSQPTVELATGATAGTGVISIATGISSASASGTAVTANSDDKVSPITALGAGTANAQTITVGTNDRIKVAEYDDLSVTVS